MPSPRSIAFTGCAIAGAFFFVLAADAFWRWQAPALLAVAAIAAVATALIAWLATCCIRLAGERDEARRVSLHGEARLAEAQHRIGNNLTVISAMLSIQSRQLGDPGARRAIEQAAGRIRVIADINYLLNHLTSLNVRIDGPFVGELVAKSIVAAGAENRVGYETSVEPVDLPRLLLTPLALLLNECVTSALQHDFPSEARGVIAVRLEARSDEQGVRRLTIAAGGSSPPTDLDSSAAPDAGLAFMNAFALQLDGSFRLERGERGTRAALIF
jgi:two-component system, sensor histidine kinase PdtaS